MSLPGIGITMGAGSLSKYVGSKIKASNLRSLGSNNATNKVLGRMGVAGKIGGKTNSALASMIRNSNWLGNTVADYGASSIMGGVPSMGWSHIFDERWF